MNTVSIDYYNRFNLYRTTAGIGLFLHVGGGLQLNLYAAPLWILNNFPITSKILFLSRSNKYYNDIIYCDLFDYI